MTMKNFRAEDMPGNESKSEPAEEQEPQRAQGQEQQAEEQQAGQPPAQETPESGVPRGTTDEILTWVGDDQDRARRALEQENQEERPRKRLTQELEQLVNQ